MHNLYVHRYHDVALNFNSVLKTFCVNNKLFGRFINVTLYVYVEKKIMLYNYITILNHTGLI